MGPRTRSSAQNSPVKAKPASAALTTADQASLPKLFILPKKRSPEARFLLLPDPRDNILRRYFFDPRTGPYEFTKIGTDSLDPRSILFTNDSNDGSNASVPSPGSMSEGYVLKTPEVLVAAPIDIIFIALPLLRLSLAQEARKLLQSIDDLLDVLEGPRGHLRHIFTHPEYRPRIEKRLEKICDVVDAGGEKMYRLNEERLAKELFIKAQQVVAQGLPSSIEERFVTRALEPPMMSIHREESMTSSTTELPSRDNSSRSQNTESQSSFSSGASTAISEASSTATIVETSATATKPSAQAANPSESITQLLRLRTALNFITSSYLPPTLSSALQTHFTSFIDFSVLEAHLLHLSSLRASALASRSLTDFTRKRGSEDFDEEAAEDRAEKKRRLEEEEKRKKAGESRGVRDLKKVDVSGMKKMSQFFTKKPTAAKTKS
ncbi:MAG: hypothetical protein Q9160_009197 [Pyrenula sp. 1 TL-2023]